MPAPSRHASLEPRRSAAKTVFRILGVLILLSVIGAGVYVYFAGWSSLTGERSAPVHVDPPAKPDAPAEFVPDGTADENLPFFTLLLEDYAESDAEILGEPVVNVVAEGGFEKSQMQVSFDRTKTDLGADNIFVSVRIDGDCLIGQLSTGDRVASAITAPAVGPDRNLCLIGKTRPIDW